MNLADPRLSLICDELRGRYGCHTVILYGSRARGDATDESDYDVLGIRESGEVTRDARRFDGAYLDAFIYPEWKILDPDQSLVHLRSGVVLFEKGAMGTHFLERIQAIFAAGPAKLPDDEIQARKAWAHKMLERARRDDTEGRYRRAWLLTALLENYFLFRGEWYRGPKESLQLLKRERPETYALFDNALRPEAGLDSLEKLILACESAL